MLCGVLLCASENSSAGKQVFVWLRVVAWRLVKVVKLWHDPFSDNLIMGISCYAAVYLILNIVAGMDKYPSFYQQYLFVSYDCFSLVVLMAMWGLVMRAAIESKDGQRELES